MEAVQSGQSLVEYALTYVRRGWPVFPLKEGGKLPLTVRGFKDATLDESAIRAFWQRHPKANIGVPTGERSGLFVVDIDPKNNGHLTFDGLVERFGQVAPTLECHTGGGGRHLYFKYRQGLRNTASGLGKGIDTRGEGGYVVVPPSVHDSGKEYFWEDEEAQIAELPEWLNPAAKLAQTQLAAGNLAFNAGVAKANGEPVEPGGRNVAAASLAGQFIRAGDSLAEIVRKLREWNAQNPRPLPDSELEKTAASVVRTHLSKHPADEIRIDDTPVEPPETSKPVAKEFPEELLSPPGMVGEIFRWMNETAIKPQPVLALANTLAFVGAVVGRKVRTPSDLRTNLYVLGVGDSGCGKDHSRKCVKRICEAAGLTPQLLGGEEVSSDSAILAAVYAHPSILFQFDEIGHFLANANSRFAAVHQKNIAPTFTKLFSSANTTFIGKEYSGRVRQDIVQPNVCLYGTTVPSRLYEGLTPGEITDGFLGRMIVFQGAEADPLERDVLVSAAPPEGVVAMVQAWHERQDLPRAEGNIASLIHQPINADLDDEAATVFRDFRVECRRNKGLMREANNGLDVIWSRATEHALKVALTIAAGCEYQTPIITGDVAAWSVKLIGHLVRVLIDTIRDSIAGSDYERDLLYVKRMICDAGGSGLTQTQLIFRTRRLPNSKRSEILNHLISSGEVKKSERKNGRGPSASLYMRNNC